MPDKPEKKNGIGILARFLRRNPKSTLAADLSARAIGKPLFCHPEMGAQIVRAYLNAPQSSARQEGEYLGVTTKIGKIAVIDISGPLVSRPMVGVSGTGPLSYEDIRNEFNAAMEDDDVEVVVYRLDTCGGEASQNIDLADYIYGLRGKKRLIAMVDDMAYSAGYAVTSAADEIWVTRTSGIGSIGVVCYHVDQSEWNKKTGIKVEFIYAGDHKVDFNPHNQLSDSARDMMQDEINRLYTMFVECVARNRNMSVDAVIATQARSYYGETGIEAGLADKLGTFSDLIQYLNSGDNQEMTPEPELELESDPQPNAAATLASASDADKEAAQETVKQHAEIRAVCAAAGIPDIAAEFITAGTSVNQVRTDLVSMLQAGEVEVESSQSVSLEAPRETGQQSEKFTAASVYARRNKRGK